MALPADGLIRSVSTKESVETYSYRDATGVTKVLLPGKVKTTEKTAEFYGNPSLSLTAGAFASGTAKLVASKVSQSNEGVPEGSQTTKAYTSL
jgi:hypothetical protein